MKKIIALLSLCMAFLVCFVACDKEEKDNKPTEQPSEQPQDSIRFNRYSAIKVPIVENGKKAGEKYDAMSIYKYASAIKFHSLHHDYQPDYDYELWISGGVLYSQFRDTVSKKIAIRDDLAVYSMTGETADAPGEWIYFRDVVLVVSLDGDGNLFDVTQYNDAVYHPYGDSLAIAFDSVTGYIYRFDTVAYIPNSVMDSLRPLMEQAFYEKDWKKTFDMFENGYKFIPITGAEYLELVGATPAPPEPVTPEPVTPEPPSVTPEDSSNMKKKY